MGIAGVLWDKSVSLERAGGGTGLFEVDGSWARSKVRLAATQRQAHSRAAASTDTTRILHQSRFTAPPSTRFPRMAARITHHNQPPHASQYPPLATQTFTS